MNKFKSVMFNLTKNIIFKNVPLVIICSQTYPYHNTKVGENNDSNQQLITGHRDSEDDVSSISDADSTTNELEKKICILEDHIFEYFVKGYKIKKDPDFDKKMITVRLLLTAEECSDFIKLCRNNKFNVKSKKNENNEDCFFINVDKVTYSIKIVNKDKYLSCTLYKGGKKIIGVSSDFRDDKEKHGYYKNGKLWLRPNHEKDGITIESIARHYLDYHKKSLEKMGESICDKYGNY